MQIEEIMKKMIDLAAGNHHDINHFMKVHSFARTIGRMEGLDEETQYVLEAAAIVHDIACPLCGNSSAVRISRKSSLRESFSL